MLTIIGKKGCTSCVELKDKLTKDGVEFEYLVFEDMPREPRRLYSQIIRNENNGHFPLVLNENGEVVKDFSV